MAIILFLITIFICLFILYAVARHDFVLLRQSISLRVVFDNAFISLISFFLFARLGYIIYSQSLDLLNPLRLLYLTKYWGVLPYAGFAGIIITVLLLYRKKKNKLRILDIYVISFSPLVLLDIFLQGNSTTMLLIKIVSIVVLLGFYSWFIKIHNKFTTKDGFITCMTIITYSLVLLAFSFAGFGIFGLKHLLFNIFAVSSTIIATIFLILIQKDTFNKQ